MPKNGNGKLIGALTTLGAICVALLAWFQLNDYLAFAEDVDRLEATMNEKIALVEKEIDQRFCQAAKESNERRLGELRLQEYQWMQMQLKNPNDPVINSTLKKIRADIKKIEEGK